MATLRPSPLPPPPPPDAEVRQRALDITQSFLVRAPAGSGKTELLVQRMVKLLAAVEHPEAVIAVTFTRKAAGEMRVRVLNELARQKSPLAAAPNRLRITTFDALALSLAARLPWLTRLGPAPVPTEDASPLYRAAARATLAALERPGDPAADSARQLLLRFDNNADRCETLLADALAVRDQWLPLLPPPDAAARTALDAALRALVLGEMMALHAVIAADPAASGLPPPSLAALPAWQQFAESVITDKGTLLKRNPALPLGEPACLALHRLRSLPAAPFDDGAWRDLEPLLHLLPRAAAELQLVFRRLRQCDFTEITLAAARALSDEGAPTALAFALDARLQHLLVDEVQDTSAAQFDLLAALTSGWETFDGRTRFFVGDPMQSIYGFRNARLDRFLENPFRLPELRLTANFRSLQPLVSWFNAAFRPAFGAVQDPVAGRVAFVPAQPVRPSADPAVEYHAVSDSAAEAGRVAELVARELHSGAGTIAILVHARPHLEAILPALRAHPLLGRELAPLQSSPVASDLLALAQALLNPADRAAALALLRAPWCGLTLADLHALAGGDAAPDATLAELWPARRHLLSADGQLRASRVLDIVAAATAERARRGLRKLVEWCWLRLGGPLCLPPGANPADAAALLDHLEAAAAQPGGYDPETLAQDLKYVFTPSDPNATARLQVMTIHKAKGLAFDVVILPGLGQTLSARTTRLLHWLDWPDPGGLGRQWALAARAERGAEPAAFQYLGHRLSERERQEDLRQLYVAATRARDRLHLVATLKLTRDGKPWANTPLAWLWPTLSEYFTTAPPAAPGPSAATVPRSIWRVRDAAWTPPSPAPLRWRGPAVAPPPSETELALHAADAFSRRLGVALHALLQQIAGVVPLAWNPQRLDFLLRHAGVAAADLPRARRLAAAALDRTLADDRGRWLLAPHPGARTEWALTSAAGGQLRSARVDRSFLAGGVRLIVDYKFATHEGAGQDAFLDAQLDRYRPQLDAYAAIVRSLDPHPIHCALYFPFLSAWRSWTCA